MSGDPTTYGSLPVQGLTPEKLARYVADLAAGHNHDGVNSRTVGTHTHAAGDVTSGTFADARIAQSNVTQHQAALTGGFLDNGTKTAGFTINWALAATQAVEINGTTLAITLSNPVDGGVYVLYLKQNSAPDTVTWPGSVHWKQGGVFVPSATTGRIDRVTLHYFGSVYYGAWENYWT